jgi:hypothetical protein
MSILSCRYHCPFFGFAFSRERLFGSQYPAYLMFLSCEVLRSLRTTLDYLLEEGFDLGFVIVIELIIDFIQMVYSLHYSLWTVKMIMVAHSF